MSIKKAIVMLDFLIEYETKMQNTMGDPAKLWNNGPDSISRLAKTLSDCHKDNVRVLNLIRKEIVPKCRHPKKMRDKGPDGKWYCMNCNQDL